MRRRNRRGLIVVENFDPASVTADVCPPIWVDLRGNVSSPPPLNVLPSPTDVLSGRVLPDFEGLRLRDPGHFRCGNLHQFANQWDHFMTGVRGYDIVRPWIREGVSVPSFFQHFKGEFNGRFFDSDVPPLCIFKTTHAVMILPISLLRPFCNA